MTLTLNLRPRFQVGYKLIQEGCSVVNRADQRYVLRCDLKKERGEDRGKGREGEEEEEEGERRIHM